MKRFIVSCMVMAGIVAAPASAGHPQPRETKAQVLPAETLAAFEAIAQAGEERRAGVPAADVEAQLADGLARLAASVPRLADDVAFATFVHVEIAVLGPELAARIGREIADDAPLAVALEELGAAKREWIERRVADGGADGPRSTCFMDLVLCMGWCATLDSAILRAACGLDCETDFVTCMPIRLPGRIFGEIIRTKNPGLFN